MTDHVGFDVEKCACGAFFVTCPTCGEIRCPDCDGAATDECVALEVQS